MLNPAETLFQAFWERPLPRRSRQNQTRGGGASGWADGMGLQGQTVMLLPVRLLVLLAVFFLILELWQLLIAPRLMRWRGGRWISIGFVLVAWVIFVFGIKTEGYWSEGRMVGFNLPYAIPLYFLLVLVLYLVWRWWIHRLSLEYDWKRAEDRTN